MPVKQWIKYKPVNQLSREELSLERNSYKYDKFRCKSYGGVIEDDYSEESYP